MIKTVLIHGQNHEGSTCHIARMLAEKIGGEMTEFFLPRDFDEFCVGCLNCFSGREEKCPHYEKLAPITKALDEADVIILASPVYVYHATGAMKAFLDHYAHRWMVHRPEEAMFRKQGICIATAAGGGMKSTVQDMADSMFFWGIARTYRLGMAVAAVNWGGISKRKKKKIEKKTSALAGKIVKRNGMIKPSLKTRLFFFGMHLFQRKGFNETDREYWNRKGWTKRVRPWK